MSGALKMTPVVSLMPAKCRGAKLFLSQFGHGMSRCDWPVFPVAPTSLKTKVLQSKLAEAW